MPRHILIKLTKITFKEKILKAANDKQKITYKWTPIRLPTDFSGETLQAWGSGRIYLNWWKGKTYNLDYSTQQVSHSDSMEKLEALKRSRA